jgi:hypothetical protein
MHMCINGLPARGSLNFPLASPVLSQIIGGGGETLITIVLAILLTVTLIVLVFLYKMPGIGKSGKRKFLAYAVFAIFVIMLGIAGISFSSRIPLLGEFGSLIGLMAVVITLVLGALVYVTYRNEMDFTEEVKMEGKKLMQKSDNIEITVDGILEKTSERQKESEKRGKRAEELLDSYKKRKE